MAEESKIVEQDELEQDVAGEQGAAAAGALATADDAEMPGAAGESENASVADAEEQGAHEEESEDSLTYSNGVIEKIVALAARDVPHVLGMKGNLVHFMQERFGAENLAKGVSVEVTDDNRVIVNISVIIEYGSYAPQIFEDVKRVVSEALERMTGLEVAGINLRIEDVLTRDEYEGHARDAEGDAEE